MSKKPKIAIIGGGISGLAAALELSQTPDAAAFQLYEASARLGGVLETVRDGPYLIERSADNFATLIPSALELTREFGDEAQLIHPVAEGRRAFVLHDGRLLPIPIGFSLMQPTQIRSILTTGTLSVAGKLRLLAEYFVPPRMDESDESLESFATRRLGREVYENLVEPIVSGIFTANPSTLSMQATMPQFVEMEKKHGSLIRAHLAAKKSDAEAAARRASGARYDQFLAPREGMSSWIANLAEALPEGCVNLSTEVSEISLQADRWRISTSLGSEEFDGLVIATPAAITARLFQPILPEPAEILKTIDYASSVVVGLVVPKAELKGRIDGFGMITPRKERRASLAISYTSNKYPGRTPADQILLRVFFGGAMAPEMVQHEDAELYRLAYQELTAILGWTGKTPLWQGVIRWPNAMPQYTLGHMQRVDRLEQLLEACPTLKICGAGYRGVGIPQCIRSGRQAASQLRNQLQASHAVESSQR